MPERTGDPDLMDDSDIAPAKEEFKGHEKMGKALAVRMDINKRIPNIDMYQLPSFDMTDIPLSLFRYLPIQNG